MTDTEISQICRRVRDRLCASGDQLVTVESCTGGGIAWHITGLAGSSDWFERAYITYSNEAKTDMVGVPAELICTHGAVSCQTAAAMAEGALDRSTASCALSVTGIAGPAGGSREKPVGTVCFGWAVRNPATAPCLKTDQCLFSGDRHAVRTASIKYALEGLLSMLNSMERP